MLRLDYIAAAARAGGAVICVALLGLGLAARAQDATTPAASDLTPTTTALTSGAQPTALSEGVVVTVNDEIISTYDIV